MEKHFLYILHSRSTDKFYIGETPNLKNRQEQHLNHHFKKNFTKIANDWKIVLSKECPSKDQAVFLERFIKRMKSRKFTQKIIDGPKILDDILSKK